MTASGAPARQDRRVVLEGTHAISHAVKLARARVVAAYPITPSSGVVELLSEMCADGRLDARFVAVESEHSAMATCAGASQAGMRAFTATSSHGLAYMHEMLHWTAGARLPIVLANVNRAMGSPWNIFADQSDSLSQRDTGWIQYYCENNQEVLDTILHAYRVAEHVLMPAMVCLDAFFLSHTSEPVDLPDQAAVDRFLPPFDPPYALDPEAPRAFGGMLLGDGYMELRARMQASMDAALVEAERAAVDWAGFTGRYHPTVELWRGDEERALGDTELALVTMGTIAGTARPVIADRVSRGQAAALVRPRLFRPFPVAALRHAVGGCRKVAVIDRNISFGCGGIVASELRAALAGQPDAPTVFSFIAGLGGREVMPDTIDDILKYVESHDAPESETLWIDLNPSES